jgi:hypothetical protein
MGIYHLRTLAGPKVSGRIRELWQGLRTLAGYANSARSKGHWQVPLFLLLKILLNSTADLFQGDLCQFCLVLGN